MLLSEIKISCRVKQHEVFIYYSDKEILSIAPVTREAVNQQLSKLSIFLNCPDWITYTQEW